MSVPAAVAGSPGASAALLRDGAFRALWIAGGLNGVVRWLEFLAISVYVFQITGSAFQVALIGTLRLVPLALFGAFAGAVAERIGRRAVFLWCAGTMALVAAAQAVLVQAGQIALWHIAVGAFCSGVFWATDLPARRTMMAELAGTDRVAPAMGLDSATNNATRMLGPLLGGVLFELLGLGGAFVIAALLYLGCVLLVVRVREERAAPSAARRMLASILDGLRIVRRDRAIVGTLAITVIFNVFGFPVVSMVPVIGKDELGLSPGLVGLLMGAEGAGALVGAVLAAFYARPAMFRRVYWGGCMLYLTMVLALGLATTAPLAGLCLLAVGVGGAGFATMQSTLVFLSAPPEARSRLMGVLSVFIGSSPIGFLHVGLLAEWLGAPTALLVMAGEGVVLLLLLWWRVPEVR